jgi:hypothetical protein
MCVSMYVCESVSHLFLSLLRTHSYNRDKFLTRIKKKAKNSKSERSAAYFKLSYAYYLSVVESESWFNCEITPKGARKTAQLKAARKALVCSDMKADSLHAPGMTVSEYVELALDGTTRYTPPSPSSSSSAQPARTPLTFQQSVAPIIPSVDQVERHVVTMMERARAISTREAVLSLAIQNKDILEELLHTLPTYAYLVHGVWVLKTCHAHDVESGLRGFRDRLIIALWQKPHGVKRYARMCVCVCVVIRTFNHPIFCPLLSSLSLSHTCARTHIHCPQHRHLNLPLAQ